MHVELKVKEAEERNVTYVLRRVILHLQLDAGALACDEHTADNTHLRPYFSALANDETFCRRPTVVVVI